MAILLSQRELGEIISRELGGRQAEAAGFKGSAKGYSLCVGLNEVDQSVYDGLAKLRAPENDARAMRDLLIAQRFAADILIGSDATSRNVLSWLVSISKIAASGDFIIFYYSGHGGQIPDLVGSEESDRLDETLCLYDRMLIDDEIYAALATYPSGCSIIMISDSCHSGTVLKGTNLEIYLAGYKNFLGASKSEHSMAAAKSAPPDITFPLYAKHASVYEGIQWAAQLKSGDVVPAILLGACQDNQPALDGETHSVFTKRLLDIWNNGQFRCSS